MSNVFLGLGGNLGDRRDNLRAAVSALSEFGRVLATSRLYESAPMYVTDQPAFLNMAVHLDAELPPHDLLHGLKDLENRLGRIESKRYGPRQIDLDILLYEDVVIESADLIVPHPRLCERRFALAPLADIAGSVIHPVLGRSIFALLADLVDDGDVAIAASLALDNPL